MALIGVNITTRNYGGIMEQFWAFFKEHFEGIIVLLIGGFVPTIIWFFNFYRSQILEDAEKTLNKATRRLDQEINIIKEKISLVKENVGHLEEKQEYFIENLQRDLESISKKLEGLETLKIELQGTRELMLLQNNSFRQQIDDFKNFIKSYLLK